jgi:BirA family biotin operon repressor/biotin-[acetyl-CoA-carboxylase] ligase
MTREIHRFETIDSTMRKAAELERAGCPSGTAVVADEQTAGQGRHGRHWDSQKGAGLYVSVVLRLPVAPDSLPLITLALGLATQDAILKATDLECDLRWPNDVMLNGRKCCGILVQLQDAAVIAGIGINVNQTAFPAEISKLATSLRMVSGKVQDRERLLNELLSAVDTWCDLLAAEGKDAILRMFTRASSYVNGRRVIVDQGGNSIEGTTEGLDASGFLLLRRPNGQRTTILAGGVRPAQ